MRAFVKRLPIVGPLARETYRWIMSRRTVTFGSTGLYWQQRYAEGGNSGDGSYGRLAEFKAEVLNAAVAEHGIRSVIEFGCGDGNQLTLARYPEYTGFDISEIAVELCRQRFVNDATKRFATMDAYSGEQADLALSLDVIYHLVEDSTYHDYLERLFGAARNRVVVYSSNFEQLPTPQVPHVRHHEFLSWVRHRFPQWALERRVPNRYPYRKDDGSGSLADFYFFLKQSA
jgi:SAM-dependent methyltransferase